MTGTPFRSDDAAIPFVRYEPDGNGVLRSAADHTYGYADALADGVVRPVVFLAYSGETRWRVGAGSENERLYAARLGEPASIEHHRPGLAHRIFLPSVPSLLQLASELEAQRNHMLGEPDRETDELEAAQRRQTELSEAEDAFTSLGADAELDQVIFDGSSFGTATPRVATKRLTT